MRWGMLDGWTLCVAGGGGGDGTIVEISYRVCRGSEECGRRCGFCRNW